MVQCEQLLTGYFRGYGLRVLKSPHLNQVLCDESIQTLLRLGAESETIAATFLWKDRMFAVSFLKPQLDELGRTCIWNHSIIIPIEPILRDWALGMSNSVSPFMKEAEAVKTPLQTCEVSC